MSSGETRDWEQLDVHLGHQGVQNLLYLKDEEEEEEEEEGQEVEQQGRKVTVSENLLQGLSLATWGQYWNVHAGVICTLTFSCWTCCTLTFVFGLFSGVISQENSVARLRDG